MRNLYLLLFTCLALSLVFSCSKDDTLTPYTSLLDPADSASGTYVLHINSVGRGGYYSGSGKWTDTAVNESYNENDKLSVIDSKTITFDGTVYSFNNSKSTSGCRVFSCSTSQLSGSVMFYPQSDSLYSTNVVTMTYFNGNTSYYGHRIK